MTIIEYALVTLCISDIFNFHASCKFRFNSYSIAC